MKNALLILLALIVTPAWAADAPPANPPAATLLAQAEPAPAPEPATPDGATAACPVTCVTMACPPPSGTVKVCCPRAPYTQTCP